MIESIYNYKQVSHTLATGGQPDENQLRALSKAGYEVVVNLGLSETEYSVPNEKALVELEGMVYFHIPVNFESPEIDKYFEFAKLFKTLSNKKIFLHCAANKRVSIFLALFKITEENLPIEKIMEELKLSWDPNEVWVAYMDKVINKFEQSASKIFNVDLEDAPRPSVG